MANIDMHPRIFFCFLQLAWAFPVFPLLLTGVVTFNVLRIVPLTDPRAVSIFITGLFMFGAGAFMCIFYLVSLHQENVHKMQNIECSSLLRESGHFSPPHHDDGISGRPPGKITNIKFVSLSSRPSTHHRTIVFFKANGAFIAAGPPVRASSYS
jgi:hypothetical protein